MGSGEQGRGRFARIGELARIKDFVIIIAVRHGFAPRWPPLAA
jgi:hypothetical protein